ncbi:MAG: hypothetical protein GX772_00890 [Alcaligenaceae bacterium]|nr:hypothetical protein [Alcaligenaceae bacterium]
MKSAIRVEGLSKSFGGKQVLFDLLVLDCSFPPADQAPRNHNDLTRALETVQSLSVRRTVLTHIGHELDAWLMENENALPEGVTAGYDGMKLAD